MRWEFVTRPVGGAGFVAWNWEWRVVRDDGSRTVSARTFVTLRDCIADARVQGFTGDAPRLAHGGRGSGPEAPFFWS